MTCILIPVKGIIWQRNRRYADIVKEMRERLETWRKETNDHIMTADEYMGHTAN